MKFLFFIFLGMVLTLSTPSTFAQTPKKETPYTDKENSQHLAKKASAAFTKENYEKALQGFRSAYALHPDFNYLPPIAQCSFLLGHYEDAVKAASQYLQEVESDNPRRPEVEKLLADSKVALAKQSPYSLEEPELQNANVDKKLNNAVTPEEKTTDKSEGKPVGKKLFIVAGVSGGAGVGAGIVAALTNKKFNELTNISSAAEPDVAKIAQLQRRRTIMAPLSDAMFGVGLITGSVGLVIKLKSKKTENPINAGLSLTPTLAVLSIQY
jgi:tetratricopeptide (TPR) repeat protein